MSFKGSDPDECRQKQLRHRKNPFTKVRKLGSGCFTERGHITRFAYLTWLSDWEVCNYLKTDKNHNVHTQSIWLHIKNTGVFSIFIHPLIQTHEWMDEDEKYVQRTMFKKHKTLITAQNTETHFSPVCCWVKNTRPLNKANHMRACQAHYIISALTLDSSWTTQGFHVINVFFNYLQLLMHHNTTSLRTDIVTLSFFAPLPRQFHLSLWASTVWHIWKPTCGLRQVPTPITAECNG